MSQSLAIYETLRSLTRPENLRPYADHVVAWNDIARNARGGDYTPLELQHSFIVEEFDELMDALRTGDKVEVVDAACDLFVVASYALYLHNCLHFNAYTFDRPAVVFSPLTLETEIMSTSTGKWAAIMTQVLALLYRLDVSITKNIEEVLRSNDTKYPTHEQLHVAMVDDGLSFNYLVSAKARELMLDAECRWIEANMLKTKGETIQARVCDLDGRLVFLNQKGKIMKPRTFETPTIIV